MKKINPSKKFYGNPMIGGWYNEKFHKEIFPKPLQEMDAQGLVRWRKVRNKPYYVPVRIKINGRSIKGWIYDEAA